MELVKTSRPLPAIFGYSLCTKRTAKTCFGLVAAILDVLEHDEDAKDAERWLLSKDFDALQSLFH